MNHLAQGLLLYAHNPEGTLTVPLAWMIRAFSVIARSFEIPGHSISNRELTLSIWHDFLPRSMRDPPNFIISPYYVYVNISERGIEPVPTDYADKKKSSKNKSWNLSIWIKLNQFMVREKGLEPSHLTAHAPKACVSTNSTTRA